MNPREGKLETARWRQVKQIFLDVRDRPESDRAGIIASACGDDESLRSQVEALVASDAEADQFLASPTIGDATPVLRADDRDTYERLQRAVAGRYSLERELGRGGMGIVYLARDVALDRRVAIKLLPPALASEADHRARFLREARTAAALSHPNIVPIHLVEERDGLVYFVMAFVDGESLGDHVRRTGPLKAADVAKVVQEVAWALAYAHSNGVVHRDIKPDNILLDKGSGRAAVSDFGIARVTAAGTMSAQGEVLGTLRYMSPEQANADAVIDGRADLYSLGVTAFFALTGRLPFDSENPAALIAMHITAPAPPVRSMRDGVPARLADAVDRCLAKHPDARFPNGEALADAIADARLTRTEIAPSVREFLAAASRGVVQVAAVGLLWWAAAEVNLRVGTKASGLIGGVFDPLIAILVWMTLFAAAMPFWAARGVVRAGFDERDVAEAAVSSGRARDANVEYTIARNERLGNQMSTIWARSAFALVVVAFLSFALPLLSRNLESGGYNLQWALKMLLPFSVVLFPLGFAVAPKRIIATLTSGTPENASILRKIWTGPVGRWLFRLAGIGLKKGKAAPVPDSAPTEIVLGRAAGELFEQLPSAQRARLGDVHVVVGGLERAATGLRNRRDQLVQAIADAGALGGSTRRDQVHAELDAARSAVDARLGSAVAALENLRLDLLRLHAGVGSADDLTASIEEARTVGEAVEIELAVRREVEAIVAR